MTNSSRTRLFPTRSTPGGSSRNGTERVSGFCSKIVMVLVSLVRKNSFCAHKRTGSNNPGVVRDAPGSRSDNSGRPKSLSEQLPSDVLMSLELSRVHSLADLAVVGAEFRAALVEEIDRVTNLVGHSATRSSS